MYTNGRAGKNGVLASLMLLGAALLGAQNTAISEFKLLTQTAGWAVEGNTLFWTESAGSAWSNITPPLANGAEVQGVFFLTPTAGWMLFTRSSTADRPSDRLVLLKTLDTGRSWSRTSFHLSAEDREAFSGNVHIFFSDPMHGWVMLGVKSSSNFRFGLLFATSDGGAAWTKLPQPPIGEAVYFATSADGWLSGGPRGDELFVTHNGGYSWSRQVLPAPAAPTSPNVSYALPQFATTDDGLMRAMFSNGERVRTVLYETHNRGISWLPVQTHLEQTRYREFPLSSPIEKGLVLLSGMTPPAISVLSSSGIQSRTAGSLSSLPERGVTAISFADEATGFLLLTHGDCAGFKTNCLQENRLLITKDQAQSFVDVTPDLSLPIVGTQSNALNGLPGEGRASVLTSDVLSRSTADTVLSIQNRAGFDKCEIPTVSQMQTWWNDSPYYAVAFYIGADWPAGWRTCSNAGLNASWVSSVAAMGWGLIPIWVGPQADTQRFTQPLVDSEPSAAEQQGISEASAASNAAANLGLSSQTVIYYDMESPTSSTPTSAVRAFIDGWVEGMHARQNIAGVYSSHPEFENWTPADIANAPDSIWFGWFFQNNVSCGSACDTVFGVPGISDSLWVNNQRIRQTSSTITSGICWGEVCFSGNSGIDEDWVDGPVATDQGNGVDTIAPTVTSFTVTPSSVALGSAFSIQATVTDSGGSGLNRIELWRAPDSGGSPGMWRNITSNTLNGNGPTTTSFSDAPPGVGVYWYGIHVFDGAGNQTNEPNGPISRNVTSTTTSPTISVTGGPLRFAYQSGSVLPAAQNLTAWISSETLGFTATSNANWLQVSPGNGSLGTSPTTLNVSVTPTGLSPNTYTGTITVTVNGATNSPQTVSVTLNVTGGGGSPPSGTQPIFTTGPIGNGCSAPTGSSQFSSTVAQIYAWVTFPNAQTGDVVEWDWYDPNSGEQISTTTINFTGGGCAWSRINVAGNANASKTGTWKVDYLYNGALKSSNDFQLTQ